MTKQNADVAWRATSRDGTQIACWTSGDGPPLLLVHGGTADHTRWRPLLPHLTPHAQVHVMDRRGRGESGDAPQYDVAREFEDVAAVVEAIADETGSDVDVYGHSYGGNCAFGAATITDRVRKLVVYEGWPPVKPKLGALRPDVEARLEALLAAGRPEAALEAFMRDAVRVTEDELAALRAQPSWQARVRAVPTILRELRAYGAQSFDPAEAARVKVPVLVLTGADSPPEVRDEPETVVAALPDARLVVIEGQQHLADVLAPEAFAAELVAFLREG